MTAVALPTTSMRAPSLLWPLARIEAIRYARHPLFLVGFGLCVLASAGRRGPMELDFQVIPAFLIGVLGIIVAARLTRSTDTSAAVISSAPVSATLRTAALCLACVVPAMAGLAVTVLHRFFVLADPVPEWHYGTFDSVERQVITFLLPVVACAGGPLLGVAVGRWLRFPGAALLVVVVTLLWVDFAAYAAGLVVGEASLAGRVLHLLSPYTAWATTDGDGERPVTIVRSFTGSPTWYMVWTLCLCGLAAVAAMWRGAEGAGLRTLRRAGAILLVTALVALSLAVAGGNARLYDTTEQGTTPTPGGEYFF